MDEDGNMEEVCGCSGDECSNYYFLINLAIFVALYAYHHCHIDKILISLIFRHKPMWWMQEEGRRKGNGRVYLPLSQPGKNWLKIFNEYLNYCKMSNYGYHLERLLTQS